MFTTLKVTLDGEGAAKDLAEIENWQGGEIEEIIWLDNATAEGLPAVFLRISCSDGSVVVAQTTWRLLHNAIKAAEVRYGEPEGQVC